MGPNGSGAPAAPRHRAPVPWHPLIALPQRHSPPPGRPLPAWPPVCCPESGSWPELLVIQFHRFQQLLPDIRNGAGYPVPARDERRVHGVVEEIGAGAHHVLGEQLHRLLFLVTIETQAIDDGVVLVGLYKIQGNTEVAGLDSAEFLV